MNDNNNIEEFLRENKPRVKDDPTFLLETQRRMRQVEGIKSEVDRQRRYGRTMLIITLVLGILIGAAAVLIVYTYPADANIGFIDSIRTILDPWKQYLILPVAVLSLILTFVLSQGHRQKAGAW